MIKKILYGIIFSQITFSQSLDSNEINSLARGKAQSAFKEYREFLSLPNEANKQDELLLKEAKNISVHSFLENVKVAITTKNWQRRTVTRTVRFVWHFGTKKAKPTICRLLSQLER